MNCYKCGTEIILMSGELVSRSETCSNCMTDIRCCKMCEFYEATAYNECRENSADRITEKEKANFCDYFKPSGNLNGKGSTRDDLLSAADALFKK